MDSFIYETTNNRFRRFMAIIFVAVIICAIITVFVFNLNTAKAADVKNIDSTNTVAQSWYSRYIPNIVDNIDPIKLMCICFIGGLILVPIPVELAFYFSIIQGNSPLVCIVLATIGLVTANSVNYLIGRKLSHHITYLLSAKAFFAMRRQVNKWGVYAILLLNIIPAPSDVLAVGLGTVRYNPRTFLFFSIVGNIIKFTIIAFAAHAIQGLM